MDKIAMKGKNATSFYANINNNLKSECVKKPQSTSSLALPFVSSVPVTMFEIPQDG